MPSVKQVVLFVIDGLRPDALPRASTPCIDRLAAQGARAGTARTVYPSLSLPCHASLFFSVPPARHGTLANVWRPSSSPIPSLIEVVHEAGLGTAAFYSWEELRDMARPGALDIACYRRLDCIMEHNPDLTIAKTAASHLIERRPALAFVYLGATDEVGHRHGWMSRSYLQAVSNADRAIGFVVDALTGSSLWPSTLCVVLADHGGHDHDHAEGLPEDIAIPWIICGPGIRRGHVIQRSLSIMDAAPTVVHSLGLTLPAEWDGQVVWEALAA